MAGTIEHYKWDHPRSRGEYWTRGGQYTRYQGSSPLSRGIHSQIELRVAAHRIIPALAGNTRIGHLPHALVPDHPRSRGEYCGRTFSGRYVTGSSPLSRGIRNFFDSQVESVRIIPALAGNTRWVSSETSRTRDHPRSRGEYRVDSASRTCCVGSSPLSRGILPHPRVCIHPIRIIPALAGNTYGQ